MLFYGFMTKTVRDNSTCTHVDVSEEGTYGDAIPILD